MNDFEVHEVIRYFTKHNLRVEDAMSLVASTTNLPLFISSCYKLNFVDQPFLDYL
jgi:hypothetical protein